jgi:hypothetical protein
LARWECLRRLAQAVAAQAILAGGRHRQAQRFVLAPAGAERVAVEFSFAAGTAPAPCAAIICAICHEQFFMREVETRRVFAARFIANGGMVRSLRAHFIANR